MCLNKKQQRGSALVIAVFVIVVMLALTLSLSRLLISSSETLVYEVQGTRTLLAAQSGLEIALTELFPVPAVLPNCALLTGSYTFTGPALQGCSATVGCIRYSAAAADAVAIFQLNSSADCTAGGFQTRRTVQIEVR
ncbi:type II secretory pathway component [Rheinheimera maricola]|uniref:Type II secretory pathway component n=1 Tax=Rheinheimera maricola TaxID=2793282 RepID=A0ABS7XFK1_9GAMM|nr:type II secretory pathway component [Rheinheimera maricola]MBZ9613830.1 type II secretory pathway component [Rheinheimera maricola]